MNELEYDDEIEDIEDDDDEELTFCENEYCENEAFKEVPVSVNRAGDETRWFCAACENAYAIGVQHGMFTERADHSSRRSKRVSR